MQSEHTPGLHVGIIMDGNGRWASARGLPRALGHREGVEAIRRVVEAAPKQGIGTLTLYAFSCDNWRRPEAEVSALMGLLRLYLRNEVSRLVENGVRLSVIGRRDRLPEGLAAAIGRAEAATFAGKALHLRIAVDYSARDAILAAALAGAGDPGITRTAFSALVTGDACVPEVDLVIRTSGEQRISNFLLWQAAYSEFVFVDEYWPDFDEASFLRVLETFSLRDRRYGGIEAKSP
jgi:undecaprenyl diphosphate synthase